MKFVAVIKVKGIMHKNLKAFQLCTFGSRKIKVLISVSYQRIACHCSCGC